MMRVRIQKWGNSLALRIPKPFAIEAGLAGGAEAELTARDGRLTVVPVRPRRFTLDGLLRGVRAGNRHRAIDTGRPQGREAW